MWVSCARFLPRQLRLLTKKARTVEERCVLCNKPIDSIVAATHSCPESIAGIILPCAAWREETDQVSQGDDPSLLNLWEAYHQSPAVPWRLLLRQPLVLWSLLLLVCLLVHEVMCSLRGW